MHVDAFFYVRSISGVLIVAFSTLPQGALKRKLGEWQKVFSFSFTYRHGGATEENLTKDYTQQVR